ncbi:hypothetical protein [uncultured Roseobacter sp.]|uniref:hypothetical protein n=1 Tax=uncultured Roseobacter sp. TaxID=114847 RepID=UPI002606C1F2|nr:hypothetical protein [uncultured Roseobacter sp.]
MKVVMVFAEPGNPQTGERYPEDASADQFLLRTTQTAYDCFSGGRDQFHRNARWFISQVFPGLAFAETLKQVWLTEGRLCSFTEETGGRTDSTCARQFLVRQISLLPNATVVAFGGKAKKYLSASRIPHIGAHALAPPGCNFKAARPSWDAVIEQVRACL